MCLGKKRRTCEGVRIHHGVCPSPLRRTPSLLARSSVQEESHVSVSAMHSRPDRTQRHRCRFFFLLRRRRAFSAARITCAELPTTLPPSLPRQSLSVSLPLRLSLSLSLRSLGYTLSGGRSHPITPKRHGSPLDQNGSTLRTAPHPPTRLLEYPCCCFVSVTCALPPHTHTGKQPLSFPDPQQTWAKVHQR